MSTASAAARMDLSKTLPMEKYDPFALPIEVTAYDKAGI
jgi:hypothetical protein